MTLIDDLLDLIRKTGVEDWKFVEREEGAYFVYKHTGLCLGQDPNTLQYAIGKDEFAKTVYAGDKAWDAYLMIETAYQEAEDYKKVYKDLLGLISDLKHNIRGFSF